MTLFAVSVANVIGRNQTTKQVYFYGSTNIDSSFQTSLQKTDVRGGINAPLLYTYFHSREIAVSINNAQFDKTWLALNAGATSVTNGTTTVTKTESVSTTTGSGTLSGSALAGTKVGIITSSGSIVNITATGSVINTTLNTTETVTATYDYSGSNIDYITGYTVTPPSNIELVMTSEIRDNAGTKKYDLQIIIPSFQISGNNQLQLSATGVSQTKLDGYAISTTAATGDYFYITRIIPA